MAHPLHWPGKYFFYPIGNTSAVCLTRDVDPSTPASILLLGCGDPRNVLYTIFSDSSSSPRKLDFTCCDFDPGVLARNVILLSLIIDNTPVNIIWDVFYHMYLDKESNTILVEKCRALAELAESDEAWRSSKYGPILKMCTTQTLKELRRYWLLYAEMDSLSPPHYQDIISTFKAHCASVLSMDVANLGPARSAGPFMTEAFSVAEIVFKNYWKTGTIFTDAKRISSATILNPTFVYSRGANACCIHYLLDPTAPFHLAAVYGNSKRPPSPADIAKAALSQFTTWCSTFQSALTTRPPESFPIIRFIWGDATSVCRSLHAFRSSRTLDIGIPVAQWRTQVNQLSREEYIISDAPSQFDVIHTSNLVDHIGLLNVIAVATPLLSSPASVLYTESLTYRGRDARRELYDLLFSDVTAFALLVDLCPVDYITGFSARSSSHELMAYEGFKGSPPQYQHILTWREPHSSDGVPGARKFDERQLGTFLYDVYHAMFEHEDSMNFFRKHSTNKDDFMRAVATSNVDHYTRESFVFLLKLIKDRVGITNESWAGVMDWFFSIQTADKTMPMDMNNSHDLWTHLHRHGIYTVHWYLEKSPRIGPFSAWSTVPDLVRIVLVVPREKLAVPGSIKDIGTPPMNCIVGGKWSNNIFSSVHVAFGRVIRMGTPNRPWVRFEEDPDGWTGSSPLVASFIMPSIVLTLLEPPTNITISLAFRSTAGSTIHLVPKLGLGLTVYSGSLMDQSHVHVVPEVQLSDSLTRSHATLHRQLLSNIGDCSVASVEFDDECELIKSFNVRVSVADKAATSLLQSGSTPSLVQLSPCIMRISLGNQMQDVPYPFPVIGSQHKLRIARKSLYIEVIVPPSEALKQDGMRLNRFPVYRGNAGLANGSYPWSIHHINLSVQPILNIRSKATRKLLNPHFGSTLSTADRSIIKHLPDGADIIALLKDSLNALFARATGILGGPPARTFSLADVPTNNSDALILVDCVRYDLSCHTFVCDAFFVPLTRDLISRHETSFTRIVSKPEFVTLGVQKGGMAAWKQVIPAFVERCRTWEHGPNCEYVAQGRTPLSEELEKTPICNCGAGKDVDGMRKEAQWKVFAPYATRVAISPLFAVAYLERIGRDPDAYRCALCRGKGKPKLKACTGCRQIKYCSSECQTKDWKAHKAKCKAA